QPYLYRIELLDRFFDMLDNREIVFVRPTCWTDPLENIIYNATLLKNGKPFEHPAKKQIYGQCWSHEGDSYALWQIYTTKANNKGITKRHYGVRITTHIDKLQNITNHNKGNFYYGMVQYLWKKDLDKLPKNKSFITGLKSTSLNHEHLKTLLVKRKSYAYENEVRLLAVPDKKHIDRSKDFLCRLKIKPSEFVTSVRLDPTLPQSDFKLLKDKLVSKYGFKPTQVSQSSLNASNKFILNLD
ncbi:MAG TPA: DUF2971 domain-containing protein, partial [Chitinophagales bacterium]|nr:DUF2971 domain-containing protein [Chitinophagales bacterium]